MTISDDAEREVRAFHEFLEDWLTGRLPEDDGDRADAVIPDDFEILSPTGERRSGSTLRADLRGARGAFADSDPAFEIRIGSFRRRDERERTCLVTYEEWQRVDGEWDGRVSSALFRRADDAPNGVEWVHLHETWLPGEAERPA